MKFMVEIDPELNPDAVGEYLRSSFFDEKVRRQKSYMPTATASYKETGCYQTFDWQKDVEELEPIEVDFEEGPNKFKEFWTRGKKRFNGEPIECRWYWAGDGELQFLLPDGSYLTNTDCKKDHGWDFVPAGEKD